MDAKREEHLARSEAAAAILDEGGTVAEMRLAVAEEKLAKLILALREHTRATEEQRSVAARVGAAKSALMLVLDEVSR